MIAKRNMLAMLFIVLGAAVVFALTEADFRTQTNADGTVTITKYEGWDRDITIPARIGGAAVSAIGEEAFKNCDLTGVVIPDSVTVIGKGAFYGNKINSA